jgi:hypothetical protein
LTATVAPGLEAPGEKASGAQTLAWLAAQPLRRTPHRLSALVALLGLVLTGALSWTAASQFDHNEDRLIELRVKEAGSALTGALPAIQTPLASAAALAEATGGNPDQFKAYMSAYVGPGRQFVTASLLTVQSGTVPIVTEGSAAALGSDPKAAEALFGPSVPPSVLHVMGFLQGANPRLGYAYTAPGGGMRYTAYGESALPVNRRLRIANDAAFADLNYALYLGRTVGQQDLLQASVNHLPIGGRHARTVVPFGDSAFTLVMSPKHALSGTLSNRLPWVIAGFGTIVSLAFGAITERLIRRQTNAEQLAVHLEQTADENRRLYAEQRAVAETLQRALLPESLPEINGVEVGVRYIPGVEGIHIGGDWYDVILIDDTHFLVLVGDVSGRGLRAATVMASLLYAVRAYAAQGDEPAAIVGKLGQLLSLEDTGHFATVLCILVDLSLHQISIVNAGHLPPLLLVDDQGDFVTIDLGLPVGVSSTSSYTPVTVPVPEAATLLAFTDGLIERRGESVDIGLKRLRDTAVIEQPQRLDDLLHLIVDQLVAGGAGDDTVLLGVRWGA